LLRAGDFNVIVVDWRAGSTTISYPVAVNRVAAIANFAGGFLDFMQENQLIDYARLHVIGFSLGAHIAGNIGKNVRRGQIDTIIGLDPSGPLFSVQNPGTRIDAADGVYVEILHTNGNSTGIGSPIGDSDFFANGGSNQPGCLSNGELFN
jgi:pancreatic triacylglycerol lipase